MNPLRKIALITGSATGIGRATAQAFACAGYTVLCHYHHSKEQAQTLRGQLISAGHDAHLVCCDVSDPDDVRRMASDILSTYHHVDALVSCAGIAQQKLFCDITDDDWHSMMGVHVDGAFFLSRAFLPGMISRRSGSIVYVSSMWGQVGASCEVHYSCAKAGLIGMTRALAKEVAPSGIRVNCVAPGVIDTAMMKDFDEDVRRELAEETPLMRLGTPADCASAILFLSSSDASFITGQVLGVNGGLVV